MKKSSHILTPLQLRVIEMRARGMTFDEIARRLGVSKSSAYAVYKNAIEKIERARKTLELYIRLTGGVIVDIGKGTQIDTVLRRIFTEADIHGIKIRARSSTLLLHLFRASPSCFDIDREIITCDMRIRITRDGAVEIIETAK